MGYMQIGEVTKLLRARPPTTLMEPSMLYEWMDRAVREHGREWVQHNRASVPKKWQFILDFDLKHS